MITSNYKQETMGECAMKHKLIYLYENDDRVTLTALLHKDHPELRCGRRPALIVLPGGGLSFLSEREAEPVALAFMPHGINTFVLRYSIGEFGNYPMPLLDVSLAVAHVRRNADKYNVDPKRIYIAGFSAGGYVAAMLGVRWHEDFIREEIDIPYGMNRPDGMILSYPVITAKEYAHRGTINNSIGADATEEMLEEHSLENLVSEKTPPAFIWHTANDGAVPVENSLFFASALSEHNVPFELHVYPDGPHGLSLANSETSVGNRALENPRAAEWVRLAAEWMKLL